MTTSFGHSTQVVRKMLLENESKGMDLLENLSQFNPQDFKHAEELVMSDSELLQKLTNCFKADA